MMEDMNDVEKIAYIEARFGITKTVGTHASPQQLESVENELVAHLMRCKEKYGIKSPVPKIRTWINADKVNFMFFDRKTGRRVMLAEWLTNTEIKDER